MTATLVHRQIRQGNPSGQSHLFFFSILIGIIVIVKVTAASMLSDILCLRGLDDAYSSFAAHGYWIPPPYLCF